MKKNIYSIIFWLSRILTIIFCCFIAVAIININFSIFEDLFQLIMYYIVKPSEAVGSRPPFDLSKYVYISVNCSYVKIICCFIINIMIYYLINRLLSNKMIKTSVNIVLMSSVCVFLNIIYLSGGLICLLVPLVFAVILLLNSIDSAKYKIINFFVLIPFVGEFILPIYLFKNIVRLRFDINILPYMTATVLSVLFLVMNYDIELIKKAEIENNIVIKDNTFCINTDYSENQTVVTSYSKKILYKIKDNDIAVIDFSNMFATPEAIVLNSYKNEYYLYDEGSGCLNFIDRKNFTINKSEKIIENYGDLRSHNTIAFSNEYNNILISLEKGKSILFDVNNLSQTDYFIPLCFDFVIYNKFRDSYLMSFWKNNSYLFEIHADKNEKSKKIKVPRFQGHVAISEQNKEIYVAFHQKGRIFVYDAQTFKFKRKIKTQYSVKHITYDEDLNVLIASGYFTGYVDIFYMDGSDKLIYRNFVGYGLREGKFDKNKKNLFMAAMSGLYRINIDMNKIIK